MLGSTHSSTKEGSRLLRNAPQEKPAYSPDDLASMGVVCRSVIFAEIKAGRLVARKAGRRTLVLAEDWKAWLHALPRSRAA